MPTVLLLCGPTSSGKTALMQCLLCLTPKRFDSISRKHIAYELRGHIEAKFFGDLLEELKELTHNRMTTLEQLFLAQHDLTFPKDIVERLAKIQELVRRIEETYEYKLSFFGQLYPKLKESVDVLTASGLEVTVVMDENIYLNGPIQAEYFIACFKHYKVITACIYNSLCQLLDKTIIRNNKFFELVKSSEVDISTIKEKEMTSNSSEFSFRKPQKIIEIYLKFFTISTVQSDDKKILEEIALCGLLESIERILVVDVEHCHILSSLGRNYYTMEELNISKVMEGIMIKIGIDPSLKADTILYVTSNHKYDYVIPTTSITKSNGLFDLESIVSVFENIIGTDSAETQLGSESKTH